MGYLYETVKDKADNDGIDENMKEVLKIFNHQQLELINSTTQCVVLLLVAFFTSILVILSASIGRIFISYWFIILDMFINAMCLFLHFSFSMPTYKRLCRGGLHRLLLYFLTKQFKFTYDVNAKPKTLTVN